MTKLEIMRAARKLLSDPNRWTKAALTKRRLKDGEPVNCHCALGAIGAACGFDASQGTAKFYDLPDGRIAPRDENELVYIEAVKALAEQTGSPNYLGVSDGVFRWNDSQSTTYEDVMAAFSAACERLFEEEQEVAVS